MTKSVMSARQLHSIEYPRQSVEVVVPLIIDILDPKSVVDFGCAPSQMYQFISHWIREILDVQRYRYELTIQRLADTCMLATLQQRFSKDPGLSWNGRRKDYMRRRIANCINK